MRTSRCERARTAALEVRIAKNWIVDSVEMSRSEQIGIVHEVVTAAYDMRRNNDPMQELFYRVQRLTANQVGERLYPTSA